MPRYAITPPLKFHQVLCLQVVLFLTTIVVFVFVLEETLCKPKPPPPPAAWMPDVEALARRSRRDLDLVMDSGGSVFTYASLLWGAWKYAFTAH